MILLWYIHEFCLYRYSDTNISIYKKHLILAFVNQMKEAWFVWILFFHPLLTETDSYWQMHFWMHLWDSSAKCWVRILAHMENVLPTEYQSILGMNLNKCLHDEIMNYLWLQVFGLHPISLCKVILLWLLVVPEEKVKIWWSWAQIWSYTKHTFLNWMFGGFCWM